MEVGKKEETKDFKIKETAHFVLYRQAISDILLAIPISIVFLVSDYKVSILYVASHCLAIVAYVAAGIFWSASDDKRKHDASVFLSETTAFCSGLVGWVDFVYAYTMIYQVAYCGDESIDSPSFYSAFVLFGISGDYCASYHSGGAMYTLIVMFVLMYSSFSSIIFSLSVIENAHSGSRTSKTGTLAFHAVAFKMMSILWGVKSFPGSIWWVISVCISASALLAVIIWMSKAMYRRSRALFGVIITFELLHAGFGICCVTFGFMETQLDNLLPAILFLSNSIYICTIVTLDIDKAPVGTDIPRSPLPESRKSSTRFVSQSAGGVITQRRNAADKPLVRI